MYKDIYFQKPKQQVVMSGLMRNQIVHIYINSKINQEQDMASLK